MPPVDEPHALIALLGAVLVASLLGSPHCAGMCGGLVLFAIGSVDEKLSGERRPRLPMHLAYHGGRAASYATLGALAAILGSALDLGATYAGFQRPAAILAGVGIALVGFVGLARVAGFRLPHLPVPKRWTGVAERAHRAAFRFSGVQRAGLVGLLTPMLPCGWLYAFALTAAGTAHPLAGAAVMIAFWLGTLPVLTAVGAGLQFLTGPLRRHLPIAASLLFIVAGVLTAAGRIALPTFDPAQVTLTNNAVPDADAPPPCCILSGAETP